MVTPGTVIAAGLGLAMPLVFGAYTQVIPFMKVHRVVFADGQVTAVRTIRRDMRADWVVTIVGVAADDPACRTIPDNDGNVGWSDYKAKWNRQVRTMPLDQWVGDPGCLERLTPGVYPMFVTWTPRDGTRPVSTGTQIVIPAKTKPAAEDDAE